MCRGRTAGQVLSPPDGKGVHHEVESYGMLQAKRRIDGKEITWRRLHRTGIRDVPFITTERTKRTKRPLDAM
jgi:hypothetical protein